MGNWRIGDRNFGWWYVDDVHNYIYHQEQVITLYKTPPLWGLPSLSPACMKLETWFRMAKLDYQTNTAVNLAIAPKGKIPFIESPVTTHGF